MALQAIPGGYFEPISHAYYSEDGAWIPSATQVCELVGYSDYSGVNPAILEAKSELGTLVHYLTAEWDLYGDYDELRVTEKAEPRMRAWKSFREGNRFVPNPEWVEKPIIASIYGMKVGVTPDRFGLYGKYEAVIEIKNVEQPTHSWAVQTAIQEMGIFRRNQCGRAMRMAVQLKENGRYHIDQHKEHAQDAADAIAALTTVYRRLRKGEKVWERL